MGDKIFSKIYSKKGRENFEKIFGKNKKKVLRELKKDSEQKEENK